VCWCAVLLEDESGGQPATAGAAVMHTKSKSKKTLKTKVEKIISAVG